MDRGSWQSDRRTAGVSDLELPRSVRPDARTRAGWSADAVVLDGRRSWEFSGDRARGPTTERRVRDRSGATCRRAERERRRAESAAVGLHPRNGQCAMEPGGWAVEHALPRLQDRLLHRCRDWPHAFARRRRYAVAALGNADLHADPPE